MQRVWIAGGMAALLVGIWGATAPASAEPTEYCGARISEAEDTVKMIQGAMGRITNAEARSEIEARVTDAQNHIVSAKAATQEGECVRQVELAKTLAQDALYLVTQQ